MNRTTWCATQTSFGCTQDYSFQLTTLPDDWQQLMVDFLRERGIASLAVGFAFLGILAIGSLAWAQSDDEPQDPNAGISAEELQVLAAEAAANDADIASGDSNGEEKGSINLKELLIQGGVLMIPIALMSLLVVTVTIERAYGLRSSRVYPRAVRREVKSTVDDTASGTPQGFYEVAKNHPSVASRILEDVLQKIGRPVPEIEHAISEGTQRESEALYANVRWLTLAAAVTPLIGLLGTVWGMIIAFYNTTTIGSSGNKAEQLAEGIYLALVTTLGGLAVAIPAAIFAHYFEGKITRVLAKIEHDFRKLCPRFESFEGKARYDLSSRGLTRRVLAESKGRKSSEEGRPAEPPPPARPPVQRA
ncbi:MAG: MotA/TolQ/ExbB proton channel family protein [Planctomycetota bacterium]